MVFIACLFFLHYLTLKEDGMLSSNKPTLIPDFPNLIWKLYSFLKIFYGSIFPKQHHALNTVFRLLQTPKFQVCFTESTWWSPCAEAAEAAIHRCLHRFTTLGCLLLLLNTIFFVVSTPSVKCYSRPWLCPDYL